jgi:glycosyltransferase involved in cell wall biosynthesis
VRIDGVRLRRQPSPWDERRARLLAGIARDLALLALTRPARIRPLLHAARNPLRPPGWRSRWATLIRLRSYLPLARLSPDIVHFEWNSAAIHYLPLTGVWRCPAVISCHGSDVNVRPHVSGGEAWGRWLGTSFGRAAAVHCVSEAIAQRARAFGMNPGQAWLIRPGVDPELFEPHGPAPLGDPGLLRVVMVADFRWLKGHEYGLQAIRRLIDSGVPARLEIAGGDPHGAVGEGSSRERLEHAIHDLGLEGQVRLLGRVSSREVRDALARADVLLHTSLSEGIPTAVLEAMACALPVVASDCGGVREAVTDGVDGRIVPLRDSRAAASALERIWADRDEAVRMGRRGRARVVADFGLDGQIAAFARMYDHVAGRAAVHAPARLEPDLEPAGTASPAGEPLRLLSAGPLSWRSGFEYSMHAVALLRERGVACEYAIAGDGEFLDALLFARHQLGLEEVVKFVPAGSANPSRCDVFVDAGVAGAPSPLLDQARAVGVAVVAGAPRRDAWALADAIAQHAPRAGAAV